MKLQRKLTNKEWAEVVALGPGVRMYRGKKTLFYNGETLFDYQSQWWKIHDFDERNSWEVIIVLPGVEIIPTTNFGECEKVKMVIMSDSVRRLSPSAFDSCWKLEYVRLSRNLEYIDQQAFNDCISLTSIFIPPSCREIDVQAFLGCEKLMILSVPRNVQLGPGVIDETALIEVSPFGDSGEDEQVNAWLQNINGSEEEYALHRACSSYYPIIQIIHDIVNRQGLKALNKKNEIGITPLKYLEENPFADIDQHELMKRYIIEMMGETI